MRKYHSILQIILEAEIELVAAEKRTFWPISLQARDKRRASRIECEAWNRVLKTLKKAAIAAKG